MTHGGLSGRWERHPSHPGAATYAAHAIVCNGGQRV